MTLSQMTSGIDLQTILDRLLTGKSNSHTSNLVLLSPSISPCWTKSLLFCIKRCQ